MEHAMGNVKKWGARLVAYTELAKSKNCSVTMMLYINRFENYARTFCSSFQISGKVLKRSNNQKTRY